VELEHRWNGDQRRASRDHTDGTGRDEDEDEVEDEDERAQVTGDPRVYDALRKVVR